MRLIKTILHVANRSLGDVFCSRVKIFKVEIKICYHITYRYLVQILNTYVLCILWSFRCQRIYLCSYV